MRKLEKNLKPLFGKGKTLTIVAGSCSHFGNPSINIDGLHNFIMRCKKHLWIHHGDLIEGIMKHDKRHSVMEHRETVLDCMNLAAEWLKKANTSCIGVLHGNHDQSPSKEIGDVVEYIAGMAKVPYLSASCFVNFEAPSGVCTGYFAHGTGSPGSGYSGEPERKLLNRQIWLRNRLSWVNADIKGWGHTHRFTVCPPCFEQMLSFGDAVRGQVNRQPILTRRSWHYTAPSMFKNYDALSDGMSYAELAQYGATDMGWIEFVINRAGGIACIREVGDDGKTKQEHYETVVS